MNRAWLLQHKLRRVVSERDAELRSAAHDGLRRAPNRALVIAMLQSENGAHCSMLLPTGAPAHARRSIGDPSLRLLSRHRNIAARGQGDSVGETLWRAALTGGAQACGVPIGELRADARDTRSLIDSFLFSGNTPLARDVMVGGRWQVRDFRHRDEERIAARYRSAVSELATRRLTRRAKLNACHQAASGRSSWRAAAAFIRTLAINGVSHASNHVLSCTQLAAGR